MWCRWPNLSDGLLLFSGGFLFLSHINVLLLGWCYFLQFKLLPCCLPSPESVLLEQHFPVFADWGILCTSVLGWLLLVGYQFLWLAKQNVLWIVFGRVPWVECYPVGLWCQVAHSCEFLDSFNISLFESENSSAGAGSSDGTVSMNSDSLFFMLFSYCIRLLEHLLGIDSWLMHWVRGFLNPIVSWHVLLDLINFVRMMIVGHLLRTWTSFLWAWIFNGTSAFDWALILLGTRFHP